MSKEALHSALENVNPRRVAEHFDAIRRIPRASGNEGGVREYAISVARARGLTYREDRVGNLAIDIPASPGCEGKPRVVVQGHMDMVCVKADDSPHDFSQDPINLEVDGDLVHSKGYRTTLGADDGLGVAMALAIAEEEDLPHPPITILLTADEERGFKGAQELGADLVPRGIQGIINLDAEEGPTKICNGCASGHHLHAKWEEPSRKEVPAGYQGFEIKLEGLLGGHSGIDIHKAHGNAIMVLNRFLWGLRDQIPLLMLESFDGGEAMNTIAASSRCVVYVPRDQVGELEAFLAARESELKEAYEDPKERNRVSLSKTPVEKREKQALLLWIRDWLIDTLTGLPDGVIERDGSGSVMVSNNVGVVKAGKDVEIQTLTRGALHKVPETRGVIECLRSRLQGGTSRTVKEQHHEGWEELWNSRLVQLAQEVVREAGGEPHVFTYHAGAEVMAIINRLKALGHGINEISSVAIGPQIIDAHGTREGFLASAVEPTYRLLTGILKKLAV